jgi:hypothetical protein
MQLMKEARVSISLYYNDRSLLTLPHYTLPITEQNVSKPKKRIIKLSWDIVTIYSDVLKTLSANHPNRHGGHSDDEDDDELEAHEDSVKRLRVGGKDSPLLSIVG